MDFEKKVPSVESQPVDSKRVLSERERHENNIKVLEERIWAIRQKLANLNGDENVFSLEEESGKRSRFPLTRPGLEEALRMAERSLESFKKRQSEI